MKRICLSILLLALGMACALPATAQSLADLSTGLSIGLPADLPAGNSLKVPRETHVTVHSAAKRFLSQRGISSRHGTSSTSSPGGAPREVLPARQMMKFRVEHRGLPVVSPLSSPATGLSAAWQPAGPAQVLTAAYGKVTGRVTGIAIDPADTTGNTVYVGTTGGGVWKSTNAAGAAANVSFVPLTDVLTSINNGDQSSISIGAVTVQPGATGIILAGTGDPNDAFDSYYGTGLLRSTDNGLTWSLISQSSDASFGPSQNFSFVGEGFAGFAWSTTQPAVVVAAVSQAAEGVYVNAVDYGNSVEGLYYSSNAGLSWQLATITDGTNMLVQGPQTDFSNYDGNAATSVVWNPLRQRFYAAVRYHGYYESTDGSKFTRLANQPGANFIAAYCPPNLGFQGSQACPIFRGVLAVQPVSGDTFALSVDSFNQDQGLWQDSCAPVLGSCAASVATFATQLDSTAFEAGVGDATILQGDYNLWLAAVPQQLNLFGDTVLYAGTLDIFRCSLAAGCVWRNTTNASTCAAAGVARSQHAGTALPALPQLLYFGNDGGLWRTTDGVAQPGSVCSASDALHFDNLNGALGSLGEITGLAQSAADPTILLAGLGANGTAATPASATPAQAPWPQVLDGEGSTTAIDPSNSQNWYTASSIGVAIQQCTQGTSCGLGSFTPVIGDAQVGGDNNDLVVPAPFVLDSADPTQIIVGTCRVWRGAANGLGWGASNAISPLLDGVPGPVCNGNSALRSLASGSAAASGSGLGSTYIYAGMQGLFGNAPGHLYRSLFSRGVSSAWTDVSLSPVYSFYAGNHPHFNPGGFDVSSIVFDSHDTTGQTIYVTVEGFARNGVSEPGIYRSTDAGAHWTNIHSNLPSSPANSVVVDPANANTVYIALDTGVYVTQAVSTCGTLLVNCWSVYGMGLPNSPVTELLAYSNGVHTELHAGTYGRGVWEIPLLPPPSTATSASIFPTALTFADQLEQTLSAAQTLTVINTGSLPLIITSVTMTGDFTETNTCATPVGARGTCTLQVVFDPSTVGARTGSLVAAANVPGGQLSVTLTGNGIGIATALLVPSSMSFGTVPVGTTSALQYFVISNSGDIALGLQTPSITGPFQVSSNNCGSSVAPQSDCKVGIVFTPLTGSAATGVFSISDDKGTQTAPVNGNGVAAAAVLLAPSFLNFGSILTGTTSTAQSIMVTNESATSIALLAPSVSGPFRITTNLCGSQLAAGAGCSVGVVFMPIVNGAGTGIFTITDDAGTQTAPLSGSGVVGASILLSPSSMNFGIVSLGLISPVQYLTISNPGSTNIALRTPTITGPFQISTNLCGSSLAPGFGCTVSIAFAPTSSGAASGLFSITDDAGTQVALLTGMGASLATSTAAPLALAFAPQVVNTASAAQLVTLTNAGDASLKLITAAITGDFSVVNNCGNSLTGHSACTFSVVYDPTIIGSATGTLTITDLVNTQVVLLSGTGLAPAGVSITPASVDFGNVFITATTPSKTITVTNNGGIPLGALAFSATGDFAIAANACPATLAINASCGVQVVFTPSQAGVRTGALTVTSAAFTTPVNVALTGSGSDFQVVVSGSSTATVISGKVANYHVQIVPVAGSIGTVSVTCTGAPANAVCTANPTSGVMDGGNTIFVSIQVATGVKTSGARAPAGGRPSQALVPGGIAGGGWALALWLTPGVLLRRRRHSGKPSMLLNCALAGAAMGLAIALAGCGVSASAGSGGAPNSTPVANTPPGTYLLTVTGTVPGVQKSTILTLIIE